MRKQRRRIYWITAIVFFTTVFIGLAQSALNYIVAAGDVLDLIALEYDVSLDCVVAANDLSNPRLIFPGEAISIPRDCPRYNGQSYIPGISDQRDSLLVGQGGGTSIVVDSPGNIRTTCYRDPILRRSLSGTTYTVQQFDMLDFIACDMNVDTACLADANNLANPGYLQIGEVLNINVSCPAWSETGDAEPVDIS